MQSKKKVIGKFFAGLVLLTFPLAACHREVVSYIDATEGGSFDALVDRALLNTQYYFNKTPASSRQNIYLRKQLAELVDNSAGTEKPVDENLIREAFVVELTKHDDEATIVAYDEGTTIGITVWSLMPNRFKWFGAWEGTTEVWVLIDSNWMLSESRTEAFANSEFIQTYFGN